MMTVESVSGGGGGGGEWRGSRLWRKQEVRQREEERGDGLKGRRREDVSR